VGALALLGAACGRLADRPAAGRGPLRRSPPSGRRRELYLEGLIAAGGAGKAYRAFGLPDSAAPCYEKEATWWQRRALAMLHEANPADREALTGQLRAYEAGRLTVEW
jgi:hypothetical protein